MTLTLILFSVAEEVGDREQPGVGRISLPGVGELFGEVDAGTEFLPRMDAIMETQSGTTTSRLCQHTQEGGENNKPKSCRFCHRF